MADARPVANATLRIAPLLSVPPNNVVAPGHWIAWSEDRALAFTHFDPSLAAMNTGTWRPPEPEFALAAPLISENSTDPAVRPAGEALLWVGDAARHLSAFQVVRLTPDGRAAPIARCDVAGPRPTWMMSHVRSNATALVTYVHDEPARATLSLRPWQRSVLKCCLVR